MSGFTQNIRNGSNFALINSEIRLACGKIFCRPSAEINFLNSLQIVGFGDIGMAWSGWNPWGNENYWD